MIKKIKKYEHKRSMLRPEDKRLQEHFIKMCGKRVKKEVRVVKGATNSQM